MTDYDFDDPRTITYNAGNHKHGFATLAAYQSFMRWVESELTREFPGRDPIVVDADHPNDAFTNDTEHEAAIEAFCAGLFDRYDKAFQSHLRHVRYYAGNVRDRFGESGEYPAFCMWAMSELKREFPEHVVNLIDEELAVDCETDDEQNREQVHAFCQGLFATWQALEPTARR